MWLCVLDHIYGTAEDIASGKRCSKGMRQTITQPPVAVISLCYAESDPSSGTPTPIRGPTLAASIGKSAPNCELYK